MVCMVCVALTRVGVMDGAVLYSNIFSTGTLPVTSMYVGSHVVNL